MKSLFKILRKRVKRRKKMSKKVFKKGDRVRVRTLADMASEFGRDSFDKPDVKLGWNSNGEMDKFVGLEATVDKVCGGGEVKLCLCDRPDYDWTEWHWSTDMLELVEKKPFTKADLRNGDVVMRRNGDVEIFNSTLCSFICKSGGWNDPDDFNDDLTNCYESSRDIVAVRRPRRKCDCKFDAFAHKVGDLVYDRERDSIRELTVEEVEKEFGIKIKITKE